MGFAGKETGGGVVWCWEVWGLLSLSLSSFNGGNFNPQPVAYLDREKPKEPTSQKNEGTGVGRDQIKLQRMSKSPHSAKKVVSA